MLGIKSVYKSSSFIILLLICAGFLNSRVWAEDRNVLRNIVQACDKAYKSDSTTGSCAFIEKDTGYAILKTQKDAYQYLLIPLTTLTGIEDPKLLSSAGLPYFYKVPNFFYAAWQARTFVAEKYFSVNKHSLAENYVSLALNPANGRTQDQLHIHISCLKKDIRNSIDSLNPDYLTNGWVEIILGDMPYDARVLSAEDFKQKNVFDIVSQRYSNEMKYAEITIAPVTGGRFILLSRKGTEGNKIPAEELQDHTCSIK